MPSQYLTIAEATEYGISNANTGNIVQASTLIDAYLKRPEGLVWVPDSAGNPAYMAALPPQVAFTLTSAISPGVNVPVTLNGPIGMLQVGDTLVLDRIGTSVTETVVIATCPIPPSTTPNITFQKVINAHSIGATAEYGMTIEEQRNMPKERALTFVSRSPLVSILSGIGRYSYGRRGEVSDNYLMEEFNLLAAVSTFGGQPLWELFPQTQQIGFDWKTAQVWIPMGVLLAYYSEVKLKYIAGFQASAIPPPIKLAVAQLITAMENMPQLGNVKSYKAGDTAITMAAASALSQDTIAALQPYAARNFV